jgi:hypothetical protein
VRERGIKKRGQKGGGHVEKGVAPRERGKDEEKLSERGVSRGQRYSDEYCRGRTINLCCVLACLLLSSHL